MYKILAKTEMKKQEFEDRLKRGADALEIQLLPKETDKPEILLPYADKIETIHTTLNYITQRSVDFEDLDDWSNKNLEEAFKLAQFFSQDKRMVGVVIHLHTDISFLNNHGLFDKALLRLEDVLERYKNVYILIENGMIANHGSICAFTGSGFAETVREIKRLSKHPEKIYALVDTTHAKSNAMIESFIFGNKSQMALYKELFFNVSDLIKEVHFANCINKGIEKEEHGVDFKDDPASQEFFNISMKMVDQYIPEGLLCIEVSEQNYNQAENFSHIKDMIFGFEDLVSDLNYYYVFSG